ncbi:MAG TPA: PASTA domain-containing protein [Gemmatimonadaceae bacterium]
MPAWWRPWMAYFAMSGSGFVLAYLVVAIFVFPASAAQKDAAVPSVIGLPYADAQKKLEQSGFVAQRGELRFNNSPRGTVVGQDPEPDVNAVPGLHVTLALSNGPKVAAVPAIIGLSREQAQNALEAAGFEMGDVSERPSNEPRGAVIDSKPRPGAQAPTPSSVSFVVSAGPTTIVVPDLTGRPLSDATQLLKQVGLRVGDIKSAVGAIVATPDLASVVRSQSPIAGDQVTAGTKVDLTLGGRAP